MKQKCTGLIFEDDIDVLESMALNFELNGFSIVGTATDGCNAELLYKEKKPDFVITDLRMPNCDGNEVIEKIKSTDPKSKIFVVSAYSDKLDEKNSVEEVFEKSIDIEKITNSVSKKVCRA